MEKFFNQDLKDAISSIELKAGTAKETGNPYLYLEIKFINGYSRRMFINNDMEFALKDAFNMLPPHVSVDSNVF